jgi:hypothetical protein
VITAESLAGDIAAFLQDNDPDDRSSPIADVREVGPLVFVMPWVGAAYTIEVRRVTR